MSLKPYAEYKDTGIEWLGEVPRDWRLVPFRYAFSESNEVNGLKPVGEMLSVSGYRGVEVKTYEDENQKRTPEELENYRVVRPDQLAINTMWLNHRGLGVSELTGYVSPAYRAYWISKDLLPKFVHYLLRSEEYVAGYTSKLTGIRPNSLQLSREDLMQTMTLQPDLDTQKSIVSFLDRETAEIDTFIAESERLIELLEERRAAAITQAVTKGLDPDVPMKDSGIEWLGEIPEHWEVKPVGALGTFHYGYAFNSEDFVTTEDMDLTPVIRIGDVTGSKFSTYIPSVKLPSKPPLISQGDVVIGMSGDFSVAVWAREKAVLNQRTASFTTNSIIMNAFVGAVLKISLNYLHSIMHATTLKNVSAREISKIKVAVPAEQELEQIVATIKEIDHNTFHAINVSRRAVELARERRKALISAAVTGKIDVRSAA